VVVATHREQAELRDELSPLVLTCSELGAELVVIGPRCGGVTERFVSRHVRHLPAPADATVGHLRALAMAEVAGDIVVLLDDTRGESTAWAERVRACYRAADSPLANRPASDWSAYLQHAMRRDQ
jgi:hypothetical protein